MVLLSLFSWGWVPAAMFVHTNLSPWVQQNRPAEKTWSQVGQSILLPLVGAIGFKNTSLHGLLKLKTCNRRNWEHPFSTMAIGKGKPEAGKKDADMQVEAGILVNLRVYSHSPQSVIHCALPRICYSSFCCLCCHQWHFCVSLCLTNSQREDLIKFG